MSGATSRSGFAFQDLVLAERILAHMIARRSASIAAAPTPVMSFGVEASPGSGTTPEWDLIYEDGTVLVLEEAKSGAVDAEDRWTLWRRVRRTVAGLVTTGDAPVLHVRLTVNAANLPATPENWRTLSVQSQHVEGSWTTPRTKDEHRRAVRSASDLANEALHVLSSADADTTSPPVTLERAREILSQFRMNEQYTADSVEDQVRNHLAVLSRGAGVEALLSAVRGELMRRAESDDVARRTFTADDLLQSLNMLERLATLDPDTLRRWHELRGAGDGNARRREDSPVGLSYQEWSELQPHVRGVLDAPPPQPVALVGRGGLGKSVLLEHWLAERQRLGDETLLLTANDLAALEPDQLAAALDLGVFGARHRGKRMAIGIDGIENAADDQRRVRLLAALRAVAASDVTVCVTSRLLEWRSARGSSETIPGWRVLELMEWPEERVRDHVNASGRPRIQADLLRLLRVPLLLDLFLRTFGRSEDVPPGLQTRHGLLQAYWDRRVLPAEDERSASRRVLLLELAPREAVGVHLHTLTGDAARDLTSEGVLTLVRGGLRQFRHALLRDFAFVQWVREPPTSVSRALERLTSIRPPLVQFGALRAVLEATAAADGRDHASLISAMTPPLLFHAATVLGEFEDLAPVDLRSTVDAVTPAERSDFLRSLLLAVKLERNVTWASAISRFPADPAWATNTAWLTAAFVLQLVDVLEAMSSELHPSDATAIASLLRSWSHAPRLNEELSAGNGYTLGRLFKLLAKLDPSPETLTWLTRIQYEGSWTRFWVLSELPGLVRRMAAERSPLEQDGLRAVYVAAAGLQEEAGRLRDDVNVSRDSTSGYERFEHALVGDRNAEGLISTYPSVFVSVAIDLIAGHEADDADEREERLRDIKARWPADLRLFEDPSDEIKALQEAARKVAGSELSEEVASGSLIVDTPTNPYWQLHSEREHLLLHLRNLAEKSLSSDGAFFDAFLWPAVSKSKSALARVCILDLLTREGDCPRPDVLDELLQDGRLYFLRCAHRYLQRGIRARWPHLPVDKRQAILANISNSGRQPAGNVYWPGPFIAAIPDADRPPEFAVFIDLYRANGWELEVEEERPISVRSGHRALTGSNEWTPIGGLSTELQEPWKRLAVWERGRIPQATGADWSALVATVESLVTACLPSPEMLLTHSDLVERLSEFAHTHASTEAAQREARLPVGALRRLALWSLDALELFSAAEIADGCAPFEGASVGLPPKAELWMHLVDLADAVLWETALKDDVDLNGTLFRSIDRVATDPPARLAWNLLSRVRGWFRANGQGRSLLWELLLTRVRDARALVPGLEYLEWFERAEQRELILEWLTGSSSPAIAPARHFVRAAGQHLGWAALVRYEETGQPTGAHDVIDQLIKSPSQHGVLSDSAMHMLFVGQSVFGAKQALANGGVPFERADEFAQRMKGCWEALRSVAAGAEQKDPPAFALWVFHPVLDAADEQTRSKLELTDDARRDWWRILKPLAASVVREGPLREIHSLLRCLKDSPLVARVDGAEVLDILVELRRRAETFTPEEVAYHRDDTIACASSVIESVMGNTVDATVRDELYSLVAAWAAPPLGNETAAAAAKRLRA